MIQKIKTSFEHFRKTPAFTGFCLLLIAIVLNILVQTPAKFFSPKSFRTLITTNLPFLLVVMGQSILLIAGTMDISIGIQIALVNVVIIMSGQVWGLDFGWCCLLGIAAAMAASIICWVCVSIFRLPALLASYALTFIIEGVNVLIMDVPQGKIGKIYYKTYDKILWGFFPVALFILIFAILIWAYFKRTRFGTHIYAVGSAQRNAFSAGISPKMVLFKAFILKGFYVGMAGICMTLLTASGNPLQAEEYGMRSLAACIIGGLGFGGWGSMACGIFGGSFLLIIQNAVYYFFSMLSKTIPGFSATTYWHNLLADVIVFLGLLMTIVTAKAQRETLKQGIQEEVRRTTNLIKGQNHAD